MSTHLNETKEITLQGVPEWLHQSDQYKTLLNEQEHTSFLVDPKRLKPSIEVNDINDFIWLFQTCSFWLIDYPHTMFDFIYAKNKNKNKVLAYLYPQYDNDEVKLLVKRIGDVRFIMNLEKDEEYEYQEEVMQNGEIINDEDFISPLDGYKPVVSIAQGDVMWTFSSDRHMKGVFTYIRLWENFLDGLKCGRYESSLKLYDLGSTTFIYDKNGEYIQIVQGSKYDIDNGILCMNDVNINDLIVTCEIFINEMKSMFDKFEQEYGFHDELRKMFVNFETGMEIKNL